MSAKNAHANGAWIGICGELAADTSLTEAFLRMGIDELSAIRSLPKGTEYFFSDIHGEYEAFLHMLKSASGMIKNKIDITLAKTVSGAEREALAYLIYYPDKQLKKCNSTESCATNGAG